LPGAPTTLKATARPNGVDLTWQPPSSGGTPTSYLVYRGTSPNTLVLLTPLGNVTKYSATGLTKNVTYYFQVSAKNIAGEGPRSATVSAKAR